MAELTILWEGESDAGARGQCRSDAGAKREQESIAGVLRERERGVGASERCGSKSDAGAREYFSIVFVFCSRTNKQTD